MIKFVHNMDDVLNQLDKQENLTLFVEDWDDGFQALVGIDQKTVSEIILTARKKYGDTFTWRAFNEEIEGYWNKEYGTICKGKADSRNTEKYYLETDYHRYPGVDKFWTEDFEKPLYNKIVAEKIHENQMVHFRMVKLIPEDKNGS